MNIFIILFLYFNLDSGKNIYWMKNNYKLLLLFIKLKERKTN